jgi:hypothetical protein
MEDSPLEMFKDEKELFLALIQIGQNLPALILNYNYLLTLDDWTPEQQQTFERFVYYLVLMIRQMDGSLISTTHPSIASCLGILKIFEEAIKTGQSIPDKVAEDMNLMFFEAIARWESDLN